METEIRAGLYGRVIASEDTAFSEESNLFLQESTEILGSPLNSAEHTLLKLEPTCLGY